MDFLLKLKTQPIYYLSFFFWDWMLSYLRRQTLSYVGYKSYLTQKRKKWKIISSFCSKTHAHFLDQNYDWKKTESILFKRKSDGQQDL
jgi:hypothetical protein